jgi:multidrug efflux pump subunit AcrA (membrane-fusion protein)
MLYFATIYMKNTRNLIIGLIVAAIVIVSGWRIIFANENIEVTEFKQGVTLLNVSDYKNLNSTVEAVGVVRSENQISLRSEVNGLVKRVFVRPGQQVRAGQILVEFESDIAALQSEQALANLKAVEAQYKILTSPAGENDLSRAELTVLQAKNGLNLAQADLERVILANEQLLRNRELSVQSLYVTALQNAEVAENTLRSSLSIVSDNQFKYPVCSNYIVCDNIAAAKERALKVAYNVDFGRNWSSNAVNSVNSGIRIDLINLRRINDPIVLRQVIDKLELSLVDARVALDLQRSNYDSILDLNRVSPSDRAAIESSLAQVNAQIQVIQGQVQAFNNVEGGIVGGEARVISEARISAEQNERQARAGLRNAELALANAELALKQLRDGVREVELGPIRAQLEAARVGYLSTLNQLNKYRIVAPFDGEVGNLNIRVGDIVTPGQIILDIVNQNALEVIVQMSPQDAKEIGVHTEVFVETNLVAVVSYVGSAINPQTGNVEVGIAVLGGEIDLTIGQFVNVKFISTKTEVNVYSLPIQAVRAEPSGYSVLIVKEEKLAEVAVEVINIRGNSIEVRFVDSLPASIVSSVRGLKPGEVVNIK